MAPYSGYVDPETGAKDCRTHASPGDPRGYGCGGPMVIPRTPYRDGARHSTSRAPRGNIRHRISVRPDMAADEIRAVFAAKTGVSLRFLVLRHSSALRISRALLPGPFSRPTRASMPRRLPLALAHGVAVGSEQWGREG